MSLHPKDERTLSQLIAWWRQNKVQSKPAKLIKGSLTLPPSIRFRNDSGETVPPYGCMKVTDAAEGSQQGFVIIDKPDSTGGPFLFNGPISVPDEQFGVAQSGVVRAAYTAGTPAVGEIWGPKSAWTIDTHGDPAIEIYGIINTTDKISYGSMNFQNPMVIGKVDTPGITYDSSGTVSVWEGSTLADTGDNITAHLVWMHGDENVSTGKEVVCQWFPQLGKWLVIGSECE